MRAEPGLWQGRVFLTHDPRFERDGLLTLARQAELRAVPALFGYPAADVTTVSMQRVTFATRTGDSSFINGPENLVHLHRLRALCDAVIVGAGTVAIDNPRLTTRRVAGPNPTRVLLDPSLKLAAFATAAHVFNDGLAPTLWLCDARWRDEAIALAGAERVLAVAGLLRDDATPNLALGVAALQARGLRRLFVEGGGVTVSRFLAQRCLDRLHLAVAPVIIGDGRPGLRFAGAARLADCPRPQCSVYRMGADQLWDLDLRTSS